MSEALSAALALLVGLDSKLVEIVLLSLRVSLSAVAIAALLGLPLGAAIAVSRFPGRQAVIVVLNAVMGLPPVVVGLLVYLLLSRAGPLGAFGILFTPAAMVFAQSILILPIVAALSRQASSIAWRESAATIGRIRIDCAKTIAAGVKRIPNAPRGPARESKRYTSSPTTTGGRPMTAFSTTITACRPGKRLTAIAAPSGKPSNAAIATADRLTRRLRRTISTSLESRPTSSASAALRASDMIGSSSTLPSISAYRCLRD